jgi:1,4-dihydroxy-2-naphthoate octaprenyltransferase
VRYMFEWLKQFKRASRLKVIPVMIIPAALGGLGAAAWNGQFRPVLFLITLIGAGAAHLFSNMINDWWDYRSGADQAAYGMEGAISTNSGFLTQGVWSAARFRRVTWSVFAVAAVCAAVLAAYSGWPVVAFGAAGALIAYYYVAPPIRFGYRGKGYSELAILLSFGVLPVTGAYYVQTSQLDYRALLLSLPMGLMTTLILFNHHFLHWEADREAGKRTLVVVWGERRALRFSRLLLLLACLSLLLCVILGAAPFYALLALPAAIPLYWIYGKLDERNPPAAYLPLMGASLKAAVRFGVILMLALTVQSVL